METKCMESLFLVSLRFCNQARHRYLSCLSYGPQTVDLRAIAYTLY